MFLAHLKKMAHLEKACVFVNCPSCVQYHIDSNDDYGLSLPVDSPPGHVIGHKSLISYKNVPIVLIFFK